VLMSALHYPILRCKPSICLFGGRAVPARFLPACRKAGFARNGLGPPGRRAFLIHECVCGPSLAAVNRSCSVASISRPLALRTGNS
jgi:hypothetical protein